MYSHRLFFVILTVSTLIFCSCRKDNSTELNNPVQISDIVYLKVGYKWTYEVSGLFSPYSKYVQEFKSVDNGIMTVSNQYDNEPPFTNKAYYENGYLNNMANSNIKGPNQQFLKYKDVHVGDKWIRITPAETYYYEVLSTDEKVTVPAGTFTCKKIKVTFLHADNIQYSYFSDSSGMIMVENDDFMSLKLSSKNF